MAAASAIMLTACSSEDDVVQSAAQQANTAQAVGFDVFTQNVTNVTRATSGRTGAMTTTTLQESSANGGGFGVFGYYTDNATYNSSSSPINFMYNEMVLWNADNQGWYYNPLKYWPNETNKDMQSTPAYSETASGTTTDRLTFFAYAPYVNDPGTDGITDIPAANGTGDPTISYKTDFTSPEVNNHVDLLWGVAPAGGLSYTQVNGQTKYVAEGKPLVDMVKPSVNTNMKFLFQHSLARLGITAVAAVDQVAAGGKLDPNTKITIKSIKLTGYFGETGVLNLNNTTPSVANWTTINGVSLASTTTKAELAKKDFTIESTQIADHLRYQLSSGSYPTDMDAQTNVGVTPSRSNVIAPSEKYFSPVVDPVYTPFKKYYTTAAHDVEATATYATPALYYTYDAGTKAYTTVASSTVLNAPAYGTAATPHYTVSEVASYSSAGTCPDLTADYYTKSSDDYTYVATPTWGSGSETYYILKREQVEIPYAYATGTYYTADDNFYMFIPTNNIPYIATTGITDSKDKQDLRTVTVQIEYYITTEDGKLNGKRSQTRNVIEKTVVFPTLENGKSYNLNLVLGLTSVKVEAEVADWKVENVNADLPQNTAE